MNASPNSPQTGQERAARPATGRQLLWTAEWSIGRRIALLMVGLLQQFFHAIFFRMVLVPGYKWPEPVEPSLFLTTEAGALATSFGLLALAFVKIPGCMMRAVLLASLALGALANAARMLSGVYMGDFWYPFACDPQELGMPCGGIVASLITDVEIHSMFGAVLYLNLSFFGKLRRTGTRALPG